MRKLLAATAVALSLAAPAQAQYFWGSGPGWGQGGGWNACSNCGMRGYGAGGGYYSGIAGATNGFGAGMRGWGGIPSGNGYGMGWGGNALVGQTLGQFMGGGYGGGMFGGMGGLGMLGGLFGGMMAPGNAYPGAIYQRPGYAPGNGYAYGATRYGGGGAMPQQPRGYNASVPTVNGNPGPGYGGGYGYRGGAYPVQYVYSNAPRRQSCRVVRTWDGFNGYVNTKVCY